MPWFEIPNGVSNPNTNVPLESTITGNSLERERERNVRAVGFGEKGNLVGVDGVLYEGRSRGGGFDFLWYVTQQQQQQKQPDHCNNPPQLKTAHLRYVTLRVSNTAVVFPSFQLRHIYAFSLEFPIHI